MINKKSKKGLLFNVEERTKERIKVMLVNEPEAREQC